MTSSETQKRDVSKGRVLLNSASSAVTLVVNLTVLVWLQQFLIKRISPEEYSILPVVMSLMAFGPIIDTALTTGIGRYVTVAYAQGDETRITKISSTMLVILTACALPLTVILLIASQFLDRLVKIEPAHLADAKMMFLLTSLTLCVRLPLSALDSGMMVRHRLTYEDAINISSQLLRLGLMFALLFGLGARVLWVVVATQTGEIVRLLLNTYVSSRMLPSLRFSRAHIDFSLGREIVGYGSWNVVQRSAEIAKRAADPLLLNRFASALDVATFHVAGIAPRQLTVMMTPLIRPFIPVFATFSANNDYQRMGATYLRIARYLAWLFLPIAIPASIFSDRIMGLYLDDSYPDAGPVMAILVFVPVVKAFDALGAVAALAAAEVRAFAFRQMAIVIFSLSASVLVIAVLDAGAIGISWAALLTVGVAEALIIWPFCRKLVRVSTRRWLSTVVAPVLLPVPLSLGTCLAGAHFFSTDNWFGLFSISGVSAAAYWACIVLFFLQEQDRRDLFAVSKRLGPLAPLFRFFVRPPKNA